MRYLADKSIVVVPTKRAVTRADPVTIQIQSDAEREVVEFLAGQPSPQEIVRFHPSPALAARVHQLLQAERQNDITDTD